jgi:hypothetical protein
MGLCKLVMAMLAKEPAARPSAADVRQIARAIARELSQAYEEFELSLEIEIESAPRRPAHLPAAREVASARAEELEFGVTEMLPVVRQPRWTPEIGRVPSAIVAQHRGTIGPRAPRDQVAGEIVLTNKAR